MSRIARLAATKGGKTRAILKLAGRGALLLTVGTFNLVMWVFWAVLTIFGFVSSLKRMTERATERYCARRKLRRAREQRQVRLAVTRTPWPGLAVPRLVSRFRRSYPFAARLRTNVETKGTLATI